MSFRSSLCNRNHILSIAAVDFETVVIVKAGHEGGIAGLKGSNFCHPGYHYDRSQRWSERILKHFERSVVTPACDTDLKSPAEIETAALATFFKSACRPGTWSHNKREDTDLSKLNFSFRKRSSEL